MERDKSYKQLVIKNTRVYFSTLQRDWNELDLLEMVGILSNIDTVSGIANILNIPDLVIYTAGINKNYDLCGSMNGMTRSNSPDQSIFIQVPHIEMSLSHSQYELLMHTNDFFTRTANRDNYSLIRQEVLGPASQESDVIADKPALLWKYGIKVRVGEEELKCSVSFEISGR